MLLLAPLLAGCVTDGTVNGSYAVFLHDETSDNLARVRQEMPNVDCQYGAVDATDAQTSYDTTFGDSCYAQHASTEKETYDKYGLVPVDCRDVSAYVDDPAKMRDFLLKNWDYEARCCEQALDDDTSNDPDGNPFTTDDCTLVDARYFSALDNYAFYQHTQTFGDDSDTYRVEAVLTSEHDLQLTVHQTTDFGDVRFGFVIDPNFQPQVCQDDGAGGASLVDVDGGNWLENWSSNPEDEGYTVYHLNAGAYQINPATGGDFWLLDDTWQAGYCFGRFADEDFYCHAIDYQDTIATNTYPYGRPFFYASYEPDQYGILDSDCSNTGLSDTCDVFESYDDMYESMVANETTTVYDTDGVAYAPMEGELNRIGQVDASVLAPHLKIEENGWRPINDSAAGLGGWGSISPSYVRFKNNVDLTGLTTGDQGTPIEGDFQLYLDSVASASKFIVKGSFSIDHITEDSFTVTPLEETKEAENETPTCGE